MKREKTNNILVEESSVSDPDPAFRLKIDPDPIRIQGFHDQKFKKIYC